MLQVTPCPYWPPSPAQDYVQLHAAVVAGNTLYVGEMQQMLGERSVADLLLKLDAIRWAGWL